MGLNSLYYKYLGTIVMATTKIFIKDYDPLLLKKKFVKLDNYFRNQEITIELVSPDGLFVIESNKLWKLKPIDKDVVSQSFEGFELLFDSSYFERELVFSHIPYDHVNIDVVKMYYGQESIGKKSFLRFVVEGLYENDNNNHKIGDNKANSDKYFNFTPTNFYFLASESFDNVLVKKELNVFLSMLK
ncbi:MAG: hypothetical protein EBY20_02325 [Alphaproteobacteria bacterium]|uniref:Uncharacterized protein n=1 Tax=viral metagenome TaxID=1070528 RepID=A0A6C0HR15_9ZZZZ|nr:hypothetical protein [Alphaproteobacteria bacterium]